MADFDVVLRGGRVVDPESGLDAVRDVAITGDRVTRIGSGLPPGRLDLDVAGQVVTAGFVDLHSHAHDLGSLRLRAMDGVTTALELEAGITPVAADPGGLAVIRHLNDDDPADRELLLRYLLFPGAVVASDAMPLTWSQAGPAPDPEAWPLPPQAFTHPRTAGTFGRALRLLTRDGGPLGLAEALAKCSLGPARLLEDHVPAMRRKGRVAVGADADIVVFDPAAVTDQATYAASTRTTTGIAHVLVNGTFAVRDAQLVKDARPGRPVRATP